MFEMDKKTRNLELEAWLIETTGEEMMANHLGPNWNRFNDEMGFYPNISMTIADQVWQHQQAKVEELQNKLVEQGLICPMCGITELKEDSFLNDDIECLISVCKECGIETASISQMKINKLANLNAELQSLYTQQGVNMLKLQKRVDAAILNIENFFDEQTQKPTQREYANFIADVLHELKAEQALKGEAE